METPTDSSLLSGVHYHNYNNFTRDIECFKSVHYHNLLS